MRWVDFALVILIVIVVGLVIAVFLALIYPEQAAVFITQIREASGNGESPFWAAFNALGTRMRHGFNYRVAPFFRRVGRLFARPVRVKPTKEAPQIKASDCLPCHKDIFTQKAVNNLYVDHLLHDAAEISCNQCHLPNSPTVETNEKKQKAHSLAATITEKQCLHCHQRYNLSKDCSFCHPPGSILAKGVVPEAKLSAFYAGRVAAKKSLLPAGFSQPNPAWLKGEGNPPCAQCHTVPENCHRCHLVFHDKLPNWRNIHGPKLLKREYTQTACWSCHSATWCYDTCHPNLTNPQGPKRTQFKDLPPVPLESYVN